MECGRHIYDGKKGSGKEVCIDCGLRTDYQGQREVLHIYRFVMYNKWVSYAS